MSINNIMQTQFHHIAIIGKHQSKIIGGLLTSIAQFLQQAKIQFSIEAQTAINTKLNKKFPCLSLEEIGSHCDLAIVIGGDGTMINAARELAPTKIPMVGINKGRLGFITDIAADQFQDALSTILQGDFVEEYRSMIFAQVWRDGEEIYQALALNEVAVNRGSSAGMMEVDVEMDGDFVANFRADGVIVATPTGSTAYALAAGGPILWPGIHGWVLAPIAPHTLTNRPIVLPDTGIVTLEIAPGKKKASATFDTQIFNNLHQKDKITLQRAKEQVRILHPTQWSFYQNLRSKLRWYSEH